MKKARKRQPRTQAQRRKALTPPIPREGEIQQAVILKNGDGSQDGGEVKVTWIERTEGDIVPASGRIYTDSKMVALNPGTKKEALRLVNKLLSAIHSINERH